MTMEIIVMMLMKKIMKIMKKIMMIKFSSQLQLSYIKCSNIYQLLTMSWQLIILTVYSRSLLQVFLETISGILLPVTAEIPRNDVPEIMRHRGDELWLCVWSPPPIMAPVRRASIHVVSRVHEITSHIITALVTGSLALPAMDKRD